MYFILTGQKQVGKCIPLSFLVTDARKRYADLKFIKTSLVYKDQFFNKDLTQKLQTHQHVKKKSVSGGLTDESYTGSIWLRDYFNLDNTK